MAGLNNFWVVIREWSIDMFKSFGRSGCRDSGSRLWIVSIIRDRSFGAFTRLRRKEKQPQTFFLLFSMFKFRRRGVEAFLGYLVLGILINLAS